MKILITGNMGYVGPSVVRQLRASFPDATLVGLDIGYFSHCLANTHLLPECHVDLQHSADIRGVSKHLLSGVDAVVHLAGISNDPMGNTYEEITMDINYRASVELAKKSKEVGVNAFVFASSCSAYGFAEDGPRSETSPLNPLTAYARSKVFTERDLACMADMDFKVTCLRFGTACGMSERLRLDLVLNDFVAAAVASKKITILSDGSPWRPLINVKDMARAIDWAISRELRAGGEFLVVNTGCDEWNFQVKDLAQAVAKIVPNVEISISKHAEPDKRSYKVDFSLFKRLAPHHQSKVDLLDTISELKNGLNAMKFRDPNFRDSSFIRLKVLANLRDKGLLTDQLEWTVKNHARGEQLRALSISS